ncbi:MAG TPA: DUF2141 domain-containing protein [Stenomitos sp.]
MYCSRWHVKVAVFVGASWVLNLHSAWAGLSGDLEVKLNGLKNGNGQVCLSLFSGPKGFPQGGKGSSLRSSQCAVASQKTVLFKNVPLGSYAIAVIHDMNRDGRLNTNGLGIPNEGFGFSNNPPLRFGPANFAESQVFVSGKTTTVNIQMRYLN